MKKVKIIIITKDEFNQDCYDSAINQDYGCTVMIHYKKPELDNSILLNKNQNCADHRQEIKPMLIASDADYFLWIDMDVVLPLDAVSRFMEQMDRDHSYEGRNMIKVKNNMAHLMGGWVPFKNGGGYAAGRFVEDNKIFRFKEVVCGVARADVVGAGCIIMSRELYTKLDFEAGNDMMVYDASTGIELLASEGASFCERAFELGYNLYMHGDVVCKQYDLEEKNNGVKKIA